MITALASLILGYAGTSQQASTVDRLMKLREVAARSPFSADIPELAKTPISSQEENATEVSYSATGFYAVVNKSTQRLKLFGQRLTTSHEESMRLWPRVPVDRRTMASKAQEFWTEAGFPGSVKLYRFEEDNEGVPRTITAAFKPEIEGIELTAPYIGRYTFCPYTGGIVGFSLYNSAFPLLPEARYPKISSKEARLLAERFLFRERDGTPLVLTFEPSLVAFRPQDLTSPRLSLTESQKQAVERGESFLVYEFDFDDNANYVPKFNGAVVKYTVFLCAITGTVMDWFDLRAMGYVGPVSLGPLALDFKGVRITFGLEGKEPLALNDIDISPSKVPLVVAKPQRLILQVERLSMMCDIDLSSGNIRTRRQGQASFGTLSAKAMVALRKHLGNP